jgi:hypothetical protein
MGPDEWQQLSSTVQELRPENVLEWGSGGSTLALLTFPFIRHYVAIEHSPDWWVRVAQYASDPRLQLLLREPDRPIKSVLRWWEAAEVDDSWCRSYIKAAREAALDFDFCFIDGRARRFCIMEAMLIMRPGATIMLHDAQRKIYHDVLRGLNVEWLEPWRDGQMCKFQVP